MSAQRSSPITPDGYALLELFPGIQLSPSETCDQPNVPALANTYSTEEESAPTQTAGSSALSSITTYIPDTVKESHCYTDGDFMPQHTSAMYV
ncbi:hypothetical protein N7532_006017 [Penicillium argentinense]|uniref:Uncharacterized protein n=1 Tax=Penicillium argentinense TaxID=1131581 RepID=A0A9W9KAY7_9EURO|nr:uncharacterized protein N7532_006017 [Penicillium argentinense]KAJ5099016.1 hypothetical protein N7532_006017 [Penicillium argentinense]